MVELSPNFKCEFPLERFFRVTRGSPEYNSQNHGQGVFYSQSWLLLHYLMQGKHNLEDVRGELLNLALSEPNFTEAQFEAAVGVDYGEMEKQLRRYANRGRYNIRLVPLPAAEEEAEIELKEMSEGEVDLLFGSIRLRTRGERAAYGRLSRAFESLPESADAAAYMGYHAWAQEDYEDAAKYFKTAVERGSQSPATHMNYACMLMRVDNPRARLSPGSFDHETTLAAFPALREARRLGGGFAPELYYRFGEILLGTRIDTREEDFFVLLEGLKAYPQDERIAFYLVLHLERSGDYETALALADKYLATGLEGTSLANYRKVRKRLVEKVESEE